MIQCHPSSSITLPSGSYFITGTDTGVGKTTATAWLMQQLKIKHPHKTILGLKPLASGSLKEMNDINEDVLILQRNGHPHIPYAEINCYTFPEPIAPHIAAAQNSTTVDLKTLVAHCQTIMQRYQPDYLFIEGAGGWRCPINNQHTYAAVAQALDIPVILVVGLRLGALNHACLTAEAIGKDGLTLAGWIANSTTPAMAYWAENIAYLKQHLDAPCVATLSYRSDVC
jgi:dethiobiotin synthetase